MNFKRKLGEADEEFIDRYVADAVTRGVPFSKAKENARWHLRNQDHPNAASIDHQMSQTIDMTRTDRSDLFRKRDKR